MINAFLLWYRRLGARGFSRLWDLLKPAEELLCCRSHWGVKFLVNPFEPVDTHILRSGNYESEVVLKAAELLPPNGVVWDVGANIGAFALSLEKRRPDATIIAFEPNIEMASRLFRNALLNHSKIRICGLALAENCGVSSFFLTDGNSGMGSLNARGDSGQRTIIVSLADGDRLVASGLCPAPNLIKLDVEGAEEIVLKGMNEILEDSRLGCVLFEGEKNTQDGSSSLGNLFLKRRFKLEMLRRNEPTEHGLENFAATRP